MTIKHLADHIQELIELYRQNNSETDDGLCSICSDCWNNENKTIMAWLRKHLSDFEIEQV